jgi:hypothetical protein
VAWNERKKAAAVMRPIHTAVNEAAAKTALENLRREFGKKSPGPGHPVRARLALVRPVPGIRYRHLQGEVEVGNERDISWRSSAGQGPP